MEESKSIIRPVASPEDIRKLIQKGNLNVSEFDKALREMGINPDRLVDQVMETIKGHLRDEDTKGEV